LPSSLGSNTPEPAPGPRPTGAPQLLPISPAEYARAPSFLRTQFEFMSLNRHLKQIEAAVAARTAERGDEAVDVWTSEAIAHVTGLSPLPGAGDGGVRTRTQATHRAIAPRPRLRHSGRRAGEQVNAGPLSSPLSPWLPHLPPAPDSHAGCWLLPAARPRSLPNDHAGGAQELSVKALLLFLTHTGRALAERHGTLTCYRLALQG
jgi:hypothetical protein